MMKPVDAEVRYGLYRYKRASFSDPDPSPENQKKAFILFRTGCPKNLADA